jgi:Fusaric acid resistance protein-like
VPDTAAQDHGVTDSAAIAAAKAFGEFRAFDRHKLSARAGLTAAIPVAAMMSLGLLIGNPVDAVTMGVGAVYVGIVWRGGDGPAVPPIGAMCAATVGLTCSTIAGTLSGHWEWLHLVILVFICLGAGICTCLGRSGVVVGTQTILAFVVFGRFPETVAGALGLAGLVAAGGAAQTLFSFAVAFPMAWRRQRRALAGAYRSLGGFATRVLSTSAPTAAALDVAASVLSAPALFADPEINALTDLITTGRRIRLELIVLGAALDAAPDGHRQADPVLARIRAMLTMIADAIDGDQGSQQRLVNELRRFSDWGAERGRLENERLEERAAAAIGQVGAAARTAAAMNAAGQKTTRMRERSQLERGAITAAVAEALPTTLTETLPAALAETLPAVTPVGRPSLGIRREGSRVKEDLRRIRQNMTLDSAAGRHAVRLAAVVAGTELLTLVVALPRGYWAVVAAATVLRPGFSATFTRGAERMLGTFAGVVIASLIAVALDPNGWGLVAVVALLAFACYTVFSASFALGVAMQTGVIVFVLHVALGDTTATALDRGIETLIGGTIALAVYAIWPTWSAASSARLLANLIDSQRAYLQAVFAALTGGRSADIEAMRPLARRARLAWTDAESAVGLARSEPRKGELDLGNATETLAALRRVVYGVHALRLEVPGSAGSAAAGAGSETGTAGTADAAGGASPQTRVPELTGIGGALSDALEVEAGWLRAGGQGPRPPLPPLRNLYRELPWPGDERLTQALRPPLDELVDAVDTAAVSLGLEGA